LGAIAGEVSEAHVTSMIMKSSYHHTGWNSFENTFFRQELNILYAAS
jgi:hypothetical protein